MGEDWLKDIVRTWVCGVCYRKFNIYRARVNHVCEAKVSSFNAYSDAINHLAVYPNRGDNIIYPTLGLVVHIYLYLFEIKIFPNFNLRKLSILPIVCCFVMVN